MEGAYRYSQHSSADFLTNRMPHALFRAISRTKKDVARKRAQPKG
jgi:hypothetical protein